MANRPLERIFTTVTPSYDRMNRLLSLGMDQKWRKKAAGLLLSERPERVLDLCTGTGDMAHLIASMAEHQLEITALDYSPPMLEQASAKTPTHPRNSINFVLGDATALQFEDGIFDAVGISFAFRNLIFRNPRMEAALAEIRRVLIPGGKFVIVESSQPASTFVRAMRNLFVDVMVKRIVGRISGHSGPYLYLAESVKKFHRPSEIESLLQSAGFATVDYTPLFLGAAGIHVAR